MPISVVMPALEMAQETGKLVSWMKKEGDVVKKGEPLLEIETDKAVMEIEAPGEGVLAAVKVQPGDEVPVGRTIAWIVAPGEKIPSDDAPAETGRSKSAKMSGISHVSTAESVRVHSGEIKVSPKARRLATEKGIDPSKVRGSGPDGEILASDIVRAAETVAPAHSSVSTTARLMAERTTQSWTTVPHFFVVREVDASALLEARESLAPAIEKSHAVKLTYTDLFVATVARVLEKHPKLNSSWAENSIRSNDDINISLAIAIEAGVVAPVIHHANKITLSEIATERRDLAERARGGRLRPTDLAGGTFTISNLGMFAVEAFTAIITPPQSAILAVGSITDRVIAVNGQPTVRPVLTMTLSCDHRVVDGARAADFLRDLSELVTNLRQLELLQGKCC